MNRAEWEAQIWASELNTTARMVCVALGSFGNWTEDREVWPSMEAISERSGVSRKTVGKHVAALKEQGWLKHQRTLEAGTKVFALSTPTLPPTGILAKREYTNNLPQLSNDFTTDEIQLSHGEPSSCLMDDQQLSHGFRSVASPLHRKIKEDTQEDTREDKLARSAPVVSSQNDGSTQQPSDSKETLTFKRSEMMDAYCKWMKYTPLGRAERDTVRELVLNSKWHPEEHRPNYRLELAAQETRTERMVQV